MDLSDFPDGLPTNSSYPQEGLVLSCGTQSDSPTDFLDGFCNDAPMQMEASGTTTPTQIAHISSAALATTLPAAAATHSTPQHYPSPTHTERDYWPGEAGGDSFGDYSYRSSPTGYAPAACGYSPAATPASNYGSSADQLPRLFKLRPDVMPAQNNPLPDYPSAMQHHTPYAGAFHHQRAFHADPAGLYGPHQHTQPQPQPQPQTYQRDFGYYSEFYPDVGHTLASPVSPSQADVGMPDAGSGGGAASKMGGGRDPAAGLAAPAMAAGAKQEVPYAQLIYRAFMSNPRHAMTLQEIYQWFRDNTDKARAKGENKGWQNSIRHNLSMNAAFTKRDRKSSASPAPSPHDAATTTTTAVADSKKSTEWVLADWAISDGVQSTTRYRKAQRRSHGASAHGGSSYAAFEGEQHLPRHHHHHHQQVHHGASRTKHAGRAASGKRGGEARGRAKARSRSSASAAGYRRHASAGRAAAAAAYANPLYRGDGLLLLPGARREGYGSGGAQGAQVRGPATPPDGVAGEDLGVMLAAGGGGDYHHHHHHYRAGDSGGSCSGSGSFYDAQGAAQYGLADVADVFRRPEGDEGLFADAEMLHAPPAGWDEEEEGKEDDAGGAFVY